MKHDNDNTYSHYVYDSNDKLHDCASNIFDIFDNVNCNKLYKKAKIFICDSFDPNKKDKKEEKEQEQTESKEDTEDRSDKLTSMVDNNEIEFKPQYVRVLYSNCDWSNIVNNDDNNDGNLLINLFCASLSNNISKSNIKNDGTDLNVIIKPDKETNLLLMSIRENDEKKDEEGQLNWAR